MTATTAWAIKAPNTIWNNTPGIIQLFILVFGGMFIVWFLMFASVFIDTESTAAKEA